MYWIGPDIEKEVSLKKFKTSVIDDYLFLVIKEYTTITIPLIKDMLRVMSNYNKQTIIKFEAFIHIEKDSREYFKKAQEYLQLDNKVFIAETFSEQLHLNFFNQFYKPKSLIKIVKSESEAIAWLKISEIERKIQ